MLLQSATYSRESKTPLENFEDVLFQEQQMLFQEITMPRSKLGCQDCSLHSSIGCWVWFQQTWTKPKNSCLLEWDSILWMPSFKHLCTNGGAK